ncbi:hypothetical protein THAOC_01863 [Thalassiosira oceanica]|uniref:Uncharacterized protein n=1 Tax=Thalassiosira oceanica TaxID=159749 RepID=K0TCC3_THAOC|nr:hypothetical protein THAOC_01863 [Thalassiosira oceanica]|eukprot:EJK76378.1 hypothetical protein THAOC_01863 [Thalassiosira oceanica]
MDGRSLSVLAASHGASVDRFGRVYPRKIEVAAAYLAAKEEGGGLPSQTSANRNIPRGPASMDETDRFVVFFLYPEDPTRPLSSYVDWLCALTETICTRPRSIPTQGGLCKPNLVPYDKFRPCNTRRQSIASISSRESILSASNRFAFELEYCIQSGFILAGDILVLDNAAIHTGGENSILEDVSFVLAPEGP